MSRSYEICYLWHLIFQHHLQCMPVRMAKKKKTAYKKKNGMYHTIYTKELISVCSPLSISSFAVRFPS